MASKPPPKASAKVNMNSNFEKRLRELREHSADEQKARTKGNQSKWYRPVYWKGDVFNFDSMTEPFDRTALNDEAVSAISNPKSPGVGGDTAIAVTMAETLACMERAFRARHTMGRPRAVAHAMGRKKGHGAEKGALGNGVEYVRSMLKQARVKT